MSLSRHDHETLRGLVGTYAELAALPVHGQKADLWRRLNGLQNTRPLVWIIQVPWEEMNVDDELTLECRDAYARDMEQRLRRTLYQWRHMPADMLLDPYLHVDVVCSPRSSYADYGIQAKRVEGKASAFVPVIDSMADVERLRTPEVTVDWDETERRYQMMSDVCRSIIPVRKQGVVHQWHSPWDQMIHWYGIERLYTDMVDRPELVHTLLARFMDALHQVLDRQEELGLLDVGSGNNGVGSGGPGFTDELPTDGFDRDHVRPRDQWGCATAQIFSGVSPEMHWEFALQYEKPLMERFGLSYYGCCEPLEEKIDIIRRVDNVRKISVSPMADTEKAAERIGTDYVVSLKPNPAVLAFDRWEPELVRSELEQELACLDGCHVEIILKDITTVRKDPRRLWDWERVAMEVVERADHSASSAEANA